MLSSSTINGGVKGIHVQDVCSRRYRRYRRETAVKLSISTISTWSCCETVDIDTHVLLEPIFETLPISSISTWNCCETVDIDNNVLHGTRLWNHVDIDDINEKLLWNRRYRHQFSISRFETFIAFDQYWSHARKECSNDRALVFNNTFSQKWWQTYRGSKCSIREPS